MMKGLLGLSVKKMKALTVKMATVTLTVKGIRLSHALCIKCTKLIAQYFCSRHFILDGYVRLQSPCVWVNAVY